MIVTKTTAATPSLDPCDGVAIKRLTTSSIDFTKGPPVARKELQYLSVRTHDPSPLVFFLGFRGFLAFGGRGSAPTDGFREQTERP